MEIKAQILTEIKNVKPSEGRNSMGNSESWYNPYYSMSECFEYTELEAMSEKEIINVYKMADFMSDALY